MTKAFEVVSMFERKVVPSPGVVKRMVMARLVGLLLVQVGPW